jgi:protein CpxP
MKKQIFLSVVLVLFSISMIKAQGGFQRRTVEERVAKAHAVLDSAFEKPAATLLTALDSVFTNYYKAQDAKREELMAGGGQVDREAMRAAFQELSDKRDEKLKGLLTEGQMKKWKDEIEPTLRPQRGNRPPGQ